MVAGYEGRAGATSSDVHTYLKPGKRPEESNELDFFCL